MSENIHYRAVRKEIKQLRKEINTIQDILFKFAEVVKQRNDTQTLLIETIVKGMEQNKNIEDKKLETMLKMLLTITERQQKEKAELQ